MLRDGGATASAASDDLIALSKSGAADLAGISLRRLSSWLSHGLAGTSLSAQVTASPTRLFDFGDLVALLVAQQLVARPGVTPQQVRRLVDHLRQRGHEQPLRELRFAVLEGEIYFQMPDGTWSGDRVPDQIIIHEVIDLEPLRARIRQAVLAREPESSGQIVRQRGLLSSRPVLKGTRIPVETIRRYVAKGFDDARILQSFPLVTAEDLAVIRSAA